MMFATLLAMTARTQFLAGDDTIAIAVHEARNPRHRRFHFSIRNFAVTVIVKALETVDHAPVHVFQPQPLVFLKLQHAIVIGIEFGDVVGACLIDFRLGDLAVLVRVNAIKHALGVFTMSLAALHAMFAIVTAVGLAGTILVAVMCCRADGKHAHRTEGEEAGTNQDLLAAGHFVFLSFGGSFNFDDPIKHPNRRRTLSETGCFVAKCPASRFCDNLIQMIFADQPERRHYASGNNVIESMDENPHILVVDDSRDIREPLVKYLGQHGYRVSEADGAQAARRVLEKSAIDLVVLDIMMPGEDGLSLCRHLRETSAIPTILLTALAEETDRIVGLEMGADDYLTKPFNPRELLSRIRAVLRRVNSLPPQRNAPTGGKLRFDRWTLDTARRELIDEAGAAVPLSTGEFNLLDVFLRHPRMVLSRDQLLDQTRGREAAVFDRSIDNQVSRLRRKIERDPKAPELITTVWGGGYMFAAEVVQS